MLKNDESLQKLSGEQVKYVQEAKKDLDATEIKFSKELKVRDEKLKELKNQNVIYEDKISKRLEGEVKKLETNQESLKTRIKG